MELCQLLTFIRYTMDQTLFQALAMVILTTYQEEKLFPPHFPDKEKSKVLNIQKLAKGQTACRWQN